MFTAGKNSASDWAKCKALCEISSQGCRCEQGARIKVGNRMLSCVFDAFLYH